MPDAWTPYREPTGSLRRKVATGGPVYDVVNRQGVLIDRVAFPFGRVIAGFGTGVVYLGVRDDKGARLELARIR